MFLNKKSLYILNLFLNIKKSSITELEAVLKIKKRSILINIDTINDFLNYHNITGILRNKEYFYLNKNEISKIKLVLSSAPLKASERVEYILLKLLTFNKMILSHSFLELDITRRTLNYDLEKLKKYLQIYNLTLISLPSKGVSLQGREIDIRNLLSEYLTKYLIEWDYSHDLFNNLISNIFNDSKLDDTKKLIVNLAIKIKVSLPKEYFYKIVSIVLINNNNNNNREEQSKNLIEKYKTPENLRNNKYYEILTNFLKLNGLEKLKLYELDKVTEIFLLFDKEMYLHRLDYEVINFLNILNSKFELDILKDDQFLMKLSNIIRIGKFKSNLNFLEYKQIYKLNKNFKKYYNEIKIAIRQIIPKFYKEDIMYLTLLIKNSINDIETIDIKNKKILIVDDSFDHIYGNLVLKYVERNYFIHVSTLLYSHELKEALKLEPNLNYILTLNNLTDKTIKIPIIKITLDNILNNNYELEKYGFFKK